MFDNSASTLIIAAFITTSLVYTGCDGLQIVKLVVPEIVKNGTDGTVVLDCDYEADPSPIDKPDGLMVKWYLDSRKTPVYQWIIGNKPHALGPLRNRVNLEYTASDDPREKHRAIQIVNPTVELAGEYICTISSYYSEATKSKKMVVYVPEKDMQLTFTQNESNVMVKCYAEGVYPEPNMTISAGDMEETRQIGIETSTKDGAYNISAVMTLSNEELKDPTTFDCVLRIPSANYTVRRTTVFYPAVTTTTTRAPLTTRNYRTTPRSEQISTATQRTHYLDPDLFSEGTSSYSEPTAKPAFAFIAGVLCFLLHRL